MAAFRYAGDDRSDTSSPYAQHYLPTAEIWKLYLRETEAEDKELAQLWQIGLDQLLIFAGLFGAILTAFLIESRKDLKQDPLQEILCTLRALHNDSVTSTSKPFRPPHSSLVVNAAWFSSLGLTLISALAAVLAKGWLAQYTPATPGLHSKDACERHLRYLRSRQWRLATLVAGIPLLIQIALLLFAVGLVILTLNDNFGIGVTLLVMTVFTTCLYFLGTILPWFSPACPFQTTMSDLIPGVAANRRYIDSARKQPQTRAKPLSALQRAGLQWRKLTEFLKNAHHKPGRPEMEADILAWMLTSSTDEKAIEEAVRAVAGANPTEYLRDTLCESGASDALCQRFTRYFKITPGIPMSADDALRAEPYLYAMLRVVVPSGKTRNSGAENSDEIQFIHQVLIQAGGPLHRWDHFTEHLRPLACALGIRLILATGSDDHTEQWEQRTRNLINMSEGALYPTFDRY
ncbi:hypothetical protein B0H13DRAFT_869966 [Mycena leptocephala]|nr:hypothetical protein B0H13DRAFT_869966 [Mycena leptocephala]